MPATAITDPGEIPTWTYDNADAIRQRAQQAFQALTATIQPMVASGDVASAQRVLAASPPPDQPPQLPSFAKAVGDSLKVQWGSGLRGATSVDAGTPDGTQAPDFALPSGNDLTVGTPQQQAAPPEATPPVNGDLGLMTQGASGPSFLDAVKNGVGSAMGTIASPAAAPASSFLDAVKSGVAKAAGVAHQGLTFAVSGDIGQADPTNPNDPRNADPFNVSAIPQPLLNKVPAVPLGPLGDTRSLLAGATSPVSLALLGTGALTNPVTEGAIEGLGGSALAKIGVHAAEGAAINTGLTAGNEALTGQGLDKAALLKAAEGGAILGGAVPALGEAGRLALPAARALGESLTSGALSGERGSIELGPQGEPIPPTDAGASSAADVPQPVAPPPAQAPEPLAGVTGAGETPLAAPPVGATLRTHVNRIFGGTLTKPPEPSLMNLPGDELTGFAHPQEGLSVGQRLSNTLRNRLGQPEKFNPVVTPIMEDMRQNAATLKSQAIAMAEEAKQTWGMFKHDPQGRVILADGTKAFLPDLAQQFQQAPDSLVGKLTEPQAHALARDMSNHESFRNTAQAAGIDIGQIDGYLPRGTPDLPPGSTERITGSGGSGRTGGKVGAEKSRVYDTMEEGVANGEKYPLYPDAVAKSTSALADRIAAAHASELLKPLGSTAGDRIPADMKAQIGGLRNSLTSLNGRLDTAESRAGIANGLGNEAGKWLDTMQNRLGEDWQTPLESAYTGLRQMYRRVDALRARGSQWSGLADSIQQQLDATQAQYDQMLPDWQAAKTQAAQTPRGYSAINLAPLSAHAFPNDIANAANVALDRSHGNAAGTLVTGTTQLMNTTRTLLDFATPMRLIAAAYQHPAEAFQGFATGLKSVFRDPAALGETIANQNALAASDPSHTNVNTMIRDYGLKLSSTHAPGDLNSRAGIIQGGIRNLPVLSAGSRFINTYIDSFRIRALDDAIDRYRKAGLIDTPGSRQALGNVVNIATGAGKIPLLGNDSGLINFPQWLGSQINLVTKAATDGTIQGAYARESLAKVIGGGIALTYAVNAAQGKDTTWQNGVPRMWLGSTSINPFGPWGSLIKAAAHASPVSLDKDHNWQKPDALYLLRSKGAPPLQIATDLMSGYSFSGITPSVTSPNYMVRQIVPYTLSNAGFPSVVRNNSPISLPAPRESLGTWALNSFGVRATDKTPTDRLNELAQAKGFNDYFSAPASAQAAIRGENPDAWAAWVGQASPKEQQYQTAKSNFLAQQQARDDALLSGKLAFKDYKSTSDSQNQQLLGQEAQIWGATSRPPVNAAQRYYQEINKATDPNTKVTDWNAVDAWKAQQTTGDLKYISDNTGLNKTPLAKLKSSLANTYYAIPKYRGLTPQESDAVDTVYAAVVNGAGVRHDQASLLRSLVSLPNYDQLDPQTVTNVRRKILGGLGETAARQIWLKAHPEAAIFKNSGGTFSPEQIAAINAALAKQK